MITKRDTRSPQRYPTNEVLQRERQAVELHLAGASYDAIAEQVGYRDRGGAYKAVRRALERAVISSVDEQRESAVARCDRMLRALWPKALGGDPDAEKACHRWETRRAKLLGLDAPTQVRATITSELDSEIEALVQQLTEVRT